MLSTQEWLKCIYSLLSTCLGFGILNPSWSFVAICRAFTPGYGDPPGYDDGSNENHLIDW